MNFCSDNVAGVTPEILAAIEIANREAASRPYGNDAWTKRVEQHLAVIFERPVVAFPVISGTAANALSLSVMTPPYGVIYCHDEAHIAVDECGAPEMYTGGAKLRPIPGADGKIPLDALAKILANSCAGDVHRVQPAALSLTQATEAGTVYKPAEVAALCALAKQHGLKTHMDGSRFANAVAHLNISPAELTWKAGIDVLSFGASKNGALAAEAVVFFDEKLAETFGFRRKRAGHLISKMRFLSAQLDAYLTDGLWLKLARHANSMAQRLVQGLTALPGVKLLYPVEANEIFIQLPVPTVAALREAGFEFYDWPDSEPGTIRLVTAFNTEQGAVDHFLDTAKRLGNVAA
ncbi:MAG: low specificity L-threonine aldolase [Rhodospirillaceae bacterium]|nr:MAG: low specificity L-threonine aldolase [Rhodospirillaceae bacterium]